MLAPRSSSAGWAWPPSRISTPAGRAPGLPPCTRELLMVRYRSCTGERLFFVGGGIASTQRSSKSEKRSSSAAMLPLKWWTCAQSPGRAGRPQSPAARWLHRGNMRVFRRCLPHRRHNQAGRHAAMPAEFGTHCMLRSGSWDSPWL